MRDENHIPDLIDELDDLPGQAAGELAETTYERVRNNWSSGMDATGTPWRELSPVTIAKKGNADLLRDSGQMYDDLGYEVDRGDGSARVGFTTKESTRKAQLHEHGVPENNLPARPIIEPAGRFAASQAEDVVVDELRRALMNALR